MAHAPDRPPAVGTPLATRALRRSREVVAEQRARCSELTFSQVSSLEAAVHVVDCHLAHEMCDAASALAALRRLHVADAFFVNLSMRLRQHPGAIPGTLCRRAGSGPSAAPRAEGQPHILVMTSLAVGGVQRRLWFESNRQTVPGLRRFPAVDGRNPNETLAMLLAIGVPYEHMCDRYATWGMLANTLTRIAALQAQVVHRVPMQVILEDDVALGRDFPAYVERIAARHRPDLVQLGGYGEGYLTSLRGATLLLGAFRRHGIRGCPDQQLNAPWWHKLAGLKALQSTRRTPWALLAMTNEGGILRTPCISQSDHRLLRTATRADKQARTLVRAEPTAGSRAAPPGGAGLGRQWGCRAFGTPAGVGSGTSGTGPQAAYRPAANFLSRVAS